MTYISERKKRVVFLWNYSQYLTTGRTPPKIMTLLRNAGCFIFLYKITVIEHLLAVATCRRTFSLLCFPIAIARLLILHHTQYIL